MARFASAQTSEGDAIGTLADLANFLGGLGYAAITTDDPTLTVGQMVNAMLNVSGQTSAQAVTTPSATAILAAIPNGQVGSSFLFVLRNANTASGAVTLTAGAGVTLVHDVNLPISFTQIYIGRVTAVGTPAVSIYGVLSTAQLQDLLV